MRKYLLYILVILFSCSKEPQQSIESIEVNINNTVPSIDVESYFDVETILLEKTENSLIGNITKVKVFNDIIAVLDNQISESLFLFTREGKFIRKIGSKGNGAGEYLFLEDFDIINNNIYVLTGIGDQKLMVYDLDGNLIVEKRMSEYGGYALHVYKNEDFLTVRGNSLLTVNFWGRNGKLKKQVINTNYKFVNWSVKKSISTSSDTLYVSTIFNDTIFCKGNGLTISPRFLIDFMDWTYPIEDIRTKKDISELYEAKKYATFDGFSVTDKYIFCDIIYKGIIKLIYFREKKNYILTSNLIFKQMPLIDIVGDCNFGVIYSTNAFVINYITKQVQNAKKTTDTNGKNRVHTSSNLSKISPDDNPVIFILKDKKDV